MHFDDESGSGCAASIRLIDTNEDSGMFYRVTDEKVQNHSCPGGGSILVKIKYSFIQEN